MHYVPVPLDASIRWGFSWCRTARRRSRPTPAINGFEFDGSTQFMYVNFADTLQALVP